MKYKMVYGVAVLIALLGTTITKAEKIDLLYVTFLNKLFAGWGCHSDAESFQQLSEENRKMFKEKWPDIERLWVSMSKVHKRYRDTQSSESVFLCVNYSYEEAFKFIEQIPYLRQVRYFVWRKKQPDAFFMYGIKQLIQEGIAQEVIINE